MSAEYILEYGVDALEMHADALAARRARAAARRPAGHGRHRPCAGGADRGPRRGRSRAAASWSSCRSWAGARSSRATTSRRSWRTSEARAGLLGLGRAGRRPVAPGARRRAAARASSGSTAAWWRSRSRWRTCVLRRPGAPGRAARAARGGGRGARRPRGARAALPRQVVPGSAGAARRRLLVRAGRGRRARRRGAGRGGAARVRAGGRRGRAVRRRDERRRRPRRASRRYVSLDLGRLDRVVSVDPWSRIAVFEPGIRLPEADAALRAQGLALGHVPQSYEWATVGGCAATRSAGQTSTGHGRIDEQVVALECVTPVGLAGHAGRARERRRAGAARARARVGGDAGRDHAGRAARAAADRGVATTAGASARSWRARRCCATSSRTGSRPTSRGSRTRRRRG